MSNYNNVKVKVFGSRKAYKSYDLRDENQITYSIREKVLPKIGIDYHSVNVKVKRKADQSPDYLIAYMLRSDTYTADVVKIDIDENFQVQDVIQNYDDSGEEADEEEDEEVSYFGEAEYAVDFVVATPVPEIGTAKAAVEYVYNQAIAAGFTAKKLLGSSANLANYKYYLKSGVKGFINIGHGYTGGIVLDDGNLSAAWFNSLGGAPLKPAVVYFNSCQVFNNPLQPAVMNAGARTYIGGIVNLLIGPSEEVCKCFWQRSLTTPVRMGTNLKSCEKSKYPSQGAHGISGDTLIFWEHKWWNNLKVVRTHAKHNSQMAWAIIDGSSWLRLKTGAADGVTNVFMPLCEALANNHNVDVYIADDQITQVTLR